MTRHAAACAAETFRDLARERRLLAEAEVAVLRLQMDVARIPAPTGSEYRRGCWIAERLGEAGLRAAMDAAGNVVARAPGAYAGNPVVVCAHLDTVFPEETPLDIRQDGARLFGPGICDNGRGLAVMVTLAGVIQACRASFARPIEFVATTGEEGAGDLRGARHYFMQGARPHAVIAIDGAGDERIVSTGLGSRRFRITFHGPGGHSWASYGAPNAVHVAARVATALSDLRTAQRARAALTVSRIGGGTAVNAIPEDAWLEVDTRSTSDAVLARLEQDIRERVAAAAAEENGRRTPVTEPLRYDIVRIGNRPAGITADDAPLVEAAIEATRLVGRRPELATASTDANAAMTLGVPAIAIGGGGRGGGAHSSREWFDATAATAGVERALTIVATMARMAAD